VLLPYANIDVVCLITQDLLTRDQFIKCSLTAKPRSQLVVCALGAARVLLAPAGMHGDLQCVALTWHPHLGTVVTTDNLIGQVCKVVGE
jgi:hypothetical protein